MNEVNEIKQKLVEQNPTEALRLITILLNEFFGNKLIVAPNTALISKYEEIIEKRNAIITELTNKINEIPKGIIKETIPKKDKEHMDKMQATIDRQLMEILDYKKQINDANKNASEGLKEAWDETAKYKKEIEEMKKAEQDAINAALASMKKAEQDAINAALASIKDANAQAMAEANRIIKEQEHKIKTLTNEAVESTQLQEEYRQQVKELESKLKKANAMIKAATNGE